MNPLISIIIPVYNVEKLLPRCLDSLLNQTYKHLEIILVDDGSTDGSGDVCDEYARRDDRILVLHVENQGVSIARNIALDIAKGDYFGFVDPDDYCTPDMFEFLLNYATESGKDITCCAYFRMKKSGKYFSRCNGSRVAMSREEAMEALVRDEAIKNVFWNKLFTRSVFDGIRMPEKRIYEGTAVLYKLIGNSNGMFLASEPKYYYCENAGSLIYQPSVQFELDYIIAHVKRYKDMCKEFPELKTDLLKKLLEIYTERKMEPLIAEHCDEEQYQADITEVQQFFKEYKQDIDEAKREIYKKDGPLISVIVPAYNVQKYIRKCLDSLLAQTYRNLQIIVVDDESPDLVPQICDEYAEKDFRVTVIHQKNRGLCGARNAGLAVAEGEYIGFVDSDDWVAPDMYEYLYKGLKRYRADISSCRYYRVVPGKSTKARCTGQDVVLRPRHAVNEIVNNFELRTTFWNKLFKREIFEQIQFPEGRTFEGTLIMHKVFATVNKVVMLGDPKYYYIDNETSIINAKNVKTSVNYTYAYVSRYNDLVEDFPKLKQKMAMDAVKAISNMRYVCKNMTTEEKETFKYELETIQKFLLDNMSYLEKEVVDSREEIRALKAISTMTAKGFKKAYRILGFRGRRLQMKKALSKSVPKVKRNLNLTSELTKEQQQTLQRLQDTLIEILDEIVRICDKYGLKYYLYGGTLLGAVRNKGIIPWDDDMDIVMFRDDYEKFKEICKTELKPEYFFQDSFTDPNYPNLAAKIRKNNTYVREVKWDNVKMHKGIFVDILPLDYFPEDVKKGDRILKKASFLHQLCAFQNSHSKHGYVRFAYKILKHLPVQLYYKMRNHLLLKCNRTSGKKYVCSFGSHYMPMRMRVLHADWFGEGVKMELNGKEYLAPSKWESYLLHLYGENYMTLPPVEQRVVHSDLEAIRFESAQD